MKKSLESKSMRDKAFKGLKFFSAMGTELYLRGRFTLDGQQPRPIDEFRSITSVNPRDRILVELNSISTGEDPKAALVQIRFEDEGGNPLNFPWSSRSKSVGEFIYIDAAPVGEIARTTFVLDCPESAAKLVLKGRTWHRSVRTLVVSKPQITAMNNPLQPSENTAEVSFPANLLRATYEIPGGVNHVSLSFSHSATDVISSGPITLCMRDASGRELMQPGELSQHPKFGALFLLQGKPGIRETTQIDLHLPQSAATIQIQGLDWGSKTAQLHGTPLVTYSYDSSREIQEFLSGIPAGDSLYIIDTTAPPLGHETLSLRPNNLTLKYAELGIWVIFLPFGTLQGHTSRVSQQVLQLPRETFQLLIEALQKHRSAKHSVYICSSFPNFHSVTAATLLKSAGWKIIYECRDDMEEFNRVGYSRWYTQDLERYFLNIADSVVAVSPALLQKLRDMTPKPLLGTIIPNGVAERTIEVNAELRNPKSLAKRNSQNIVGYVGHLTTSWFDWSALLYAAKALPDVQFQIVGHGFPENLSLPPNVKHFGPKSHEELRAMVPDWKVGLIPFQDVPLTRSVDPNKIYEYFAWGIRCVSSRMGSVDEYPSTWVYQGREELVDAIKDALSTPITADELDHLNLFLKECSWLNRAKNMRNFIEN